MDRRDACIRLTPLVKWPSREELIKTMPMEFRKNFKQCIIIIDCFEIFIERPTNLKARAQTWSNYKHHNTVKVLVGISSQGAISFISDTSDRELWNIRQTLAW